MPIDKIDPWMSHEEVGAHLSPDFPSQGSLISNTFRITMMAALRTIAFLIPGFVSASVFPPWSRPFSKDSASSASETRPLPLVIWHGLGDSYLSEGMKGMSAMAEEVNPGTYVYAVHLDDSEGGDRQATFMGNVTEQIAYVCEQLASEPILSTAPAVNALGFSQGGQFLRGYVERCNNPPVRNLVTFGSQHNGIAKYQACADTGDWICRGAEALLRLGTWSHLAQSRVVPAQYFRDPEDLESYLEHSNFLADINNERDVKNPDYKARLASLNKFVMYMFENDETVYPKESAWFAEFNKTTHNVTELRDRQIYKEDWIGLRELDKRGKLEFRTVSGAHMKLTEEDVVQVFKDYFGPVTLDDDGNIVEPPSLVRQGFP